MCVCASGGRNHYYHVVLLLVVLMFCWVFIQSVALDARLELLGALLFVVYMCVECAERAILLIF